MAEPPGGAALRVGIKITRVFDAPREEVWREWTEPERFADWYGGADAEIPLETVTMDVREGGAWRATMLFGAARRRIDWHGTYLEVEEPGRLSFTVRDQPGEEDHELVVVVLADLGDGRTEMRFEQRGRMAPAQYDRAREGWGGFFDRIAERLA